MMQIKHLNDRVEIKFLGETIMVMRRPDTPWPDIASAIIDHGIRIADMHLLRLCDALMPYMKGKT